MQFVVPLLVVIALAIIGGPLVGGVALVGALLFLVPGLGIVLGLVVLAIAIWMHFGVNSVLFIAAFVIFAFIKILSTTAAHAKQGAAGVTPQNDVELLERKRIEGSEFYEDKYGRKWRKIAGIFKPADDQP